MNACTGCGLADGELAALLVDDWGWRTKPCGGCFSRYARWVKDNCRFEDDT